MSEAPQQSAGPGGKNKFQAQKVAELVAGHLRRKIVGGELPDGAELPPEWEMMEEYGVSRPSLREALRILETERLIRIRRGKFGGAVVKKPTANSAAYHLGLTLRANEVTSADLAIARGFIEPACAVLTAQLNDRRAIVDELSGLVDQSERTETTTAFAASTQLFHIRLTQLCGNMTLTIISSTLEAIWNAQEWRTVHMDPPPDPTSRRRSIRAHRRLISAIADGSPERARRVMQTHLADTQSITVSLTESAPIELTE